MITSNEKLNAFMPGDPRETVMSQTGSREQAGPIQNGNGGESS